MTTEQATVTPSNGQESNTVIDLDNSNIEVISQPNTPAKNNAIAILDTSSKKFLDGLKRRNDNRLKLIEWVDNELVKDSDFGSIDVKTRNGGKVPTKPFLFKSGAEKIMAMLGLVAKFPNLSKYEEAAIQGVEIKQIILRCELVSTNGHIVSEGVGCRHIAKDSGDLNKSFKMAEKSATIDAVLRTMGLSEMFTQDKEAVEERINAEAQQAAPVQNAQPVQPQPKPQGIGSQSQLHQRIEAVIAAEAEVKGVNAHSLRESVKHLLIAQSNGAFEHFPEVTPDWANWLISVIPECAVQHANGE